MKVTGCVLRDVVSELFGDDRDTENVCAVCTGLIVQTQEMLDKVKKEEGEEKEKEMDTKIRYNVMVACYLGSL